MYVANFITSRFHPYETINIVLDHTNFGSAQRGIGRMSGGWEVDNQDNMLFGVDMIITGCINHTASPRDV